MQKHKVTNSVLQPCVSAFEFLFLLQSASGLTTVWAFLHALQDKHWPD